MRLIFTDYIASLKEEKELDSLIEDILREYDFEIVFSPKKGERQYGVDIYAVGTDWEDGIKKLFLITVKQGNLDRKNWEGGPQALCPSLQNIATVFIRNNVMPEHSDLPVKIVVAHNGSNDAAIQQNWKGFAEQYPRCEFVIWQLETLVSFVQDKLINENVFSDKARRALRKIIISLADPDYEFGDYVFLLNEIICEVDLNAKSKRHNLKQLKKINLILVIILSYCELENDLRLALKASEITCLLLWKVVTENEKKIDNDYFGEFFKTLITRKDLHFKYLEKILPVCVVKDGLSKGSRDSVTYCLSVYEHLGFIAIAGLEFLMMSSFIEAEDSAGAIQFRGFATECVNGIINLFNNNMIVLNPRLDDQIIEISLCFLLLANLDRKDDIRRLLINFYKGLGTAKSLSNIVPHFDNNLDRVFELDADQVKRQQHHYDSSSLLAILTEWTLIFEESDLYKGYYDLKETLFTDIDLILWFPDKETEKLLYTNGVAHRTSGYSLSNIRLSESFEEYKELTLTEHVNNCQESDFLYIHQGLWIMGLIASRHYRTYIFPFYWRHLIKNYSSLPKEEKI